MSLREFSPRDHQPGAVWRTLEENPRYMSVRGRVAVDERMLLCRLEQDGEHLWLEPLTGRVYRQGRWQCNAECVRQGNELQIGPE